MIAKDKDISHMNNKMNAIVAQMNLMMQTMQQNIASTIVPFVNHQVFSGSPTKLPINLVSQVSEVRGIPEGRAEII